MLQLCRIIASEALLNFFIMEILYSFDYYTESWIEVSSQPSSSSLSSVAADEGVNHGTRMQHAVNTRRRRRLHRATSVQVQGSLPTRPRSATGSSQEEYEESESESDRIMSSSNEDLHPHFTQQESPPAIPSSASETAPSDEDDDGNSTALGINNTEPVFTPQPNAFSHPHGSQPSRQVQPAAIPGSYFPAQDAQARPASQRHSYPSQRTRSHTPFNLYNPSHQADHDAALRASLSTLLSCAAAARGLSKREQLTRSHPTQVAGPSNRIEPSTLRMVPESALLAATTDVSAPPLPKRPSPASSSSPSVQGKCKRKSSSRDARDTKKKRKAAAVEEMLISPTLMTWVVSAGVVVLFSAISFSAGFAYGKEVGRLEVSGTGTGCGREAARGYGGLRRLRWSNASVVRV
ncbi:hypothetical protein MMC19_003069 [Ptychographa xylographoides]|nr:hypothetical protein [Ptychographa xylographoides]